MSTRGSRRPEWPELPADLRNRIEDELGSAVVASASRAGGWSPGSADVVELADGRRAFVKTADALVNDRTVQMHRREATVLRLLGGRVVPELVAVVDAPPWFALVVGAIDGRHPDPASWRDTAAVLDAVAALPDGPGGRAAAPLRGGARRRTRAAGTGCSRTASRRPRRRERDLHRLAALAEGMPEALHGDSVVHGDLRIDNVLVDTSGRGRLIDWPSATVGARWLDAVTYLMDVRHLGGPVTEGLRHPVLQDVEPDRLDVWLAVLGAYFLDSARRPRPAGLPGLREYQRAQGATVLAWLLERRPDLR